MYVVPHVKPKALNAAALFNVISIHYDSWGCYFLRAVCETSSAFLTQATDKLMKQ